MYFDSDGLHAGSRITTLVRKAHNIIIIVVHCTTVLVYTSKVVATNNY